MQTESCYWSWDAALVSSGTVVGADVPVCMPRGGWKQSKPPVHRSVCSQNPIWWTIAGLPPDCVPELSLPARGTWSGSGEHPPSGEEGASGDCAPKASSPHSFLQGTLLLTLLHPDRQLRLFLGWNGRYPVLLAKLQPWSRQEEDLLVKLTLPAIYWAQNILSEAAEVQKKTHSLIQNPWRHKQNIFSLKVQLKNRFQL